MKNIVSKKNQIFSTHKEIVDHSLDIKALPFRMKTDAILMCAPDYFDVVDIKNPFMKDGYSKVDKELARVQWQKLKEALEKAKIKIELIKPVYGLEDMVFSANQVLTGKTGGSGDNFAVEAIMRFEGRQKEVPHYLDWFENRGYKLLKLKRQESATKGQSLDPLYFEGHGDAIWHPDRMLLWGGHGHRTTYSAYQNLADLIEVPIITLNLKDETFYHLDTAFCPLDIDTVLYYPGAFFDEGIELIEKTFKDTIEVKEEEAHNFACNALVHGKSVFIEANNPYSVKALEQRGFTVHELQTSEFKKSGGSVFCMTLDFYQQ